MDYLIQPVNKRRNGLSVQVFNKRRDVIKWIIFSSLSTKEEILLNGLSVPAGQQKKNIIKWTI
jgi:hypothetical protein